MRNNNIMEKRINVFKYILYLLFMVVSIRLFYLQIISHEYYEELLEKKTIETIYVQAPRGKIYDKNNNLIVSNKLVMNIIYKNDLELNEFEEIDLAYKVSEFIDLDYSKLTTSYLKDFYILTNEQEINDRLNNKEFNDYKNRIINDNEFYKLKKDKVTDGDLKIYQDKDRKAIYLYYLMNNGYSYEDKIIKANCSEKEFLYFSENNSNLTGFNTKYTYDREYLYGDTLKNVIGNVGGIPSENVDYYLSKGYHLQDEVGVSGLEFVYDDYLNGEDEVYNLIDGKMYLIKEGKIGNDLTLTIDINLQKYVDNVLKQEIIKAKKNRSTKYFNHSYVVISDTYGGILAMSGKEYFKGKIIDRSIGTITDTMTVGSAVKAASMLIGYDTNTIKIGEVIKDECLKILNTPKKCSITTMGNVNDVVALQRSSNVYQFKIAIELGGGKYRYNKPLRINSEAFETYREYFSRFGLGVNTGIELLNESRGYKGSSTLPGLLLDFAIGQYDTYTTMQLNQYISTIARDGKRYSMHLLKNVYDNEQLILEYEPKVLNEINISQKYIDRVVLGLRKVITNGTGYGYVNNKLNAAGKTGTSESFMDTNGDSVIDKETSSTSFVMFYPYDNPKVSISMTSPNISDYSYTYPINKYVIRRITDKINNFVD